MEKFQIDWFLFSTAPLITVFIFLQNSMYIGTYVS